MNKSNPRRKEVQMRKFTFACLCLLGVVIFLASTVLAAEQETAAVVSQLSNELQKERVATSTELKAMHGYMKNMIDKGATKEDLKKTMVDLSKKGIKGEDLKNSMNSMNELVNSGDTAKEAGNTVSAAAHQAKMQGLKGKDLAAKVHEAVRQRKMDMEKMKTRTRERQKEMKKESKEIQKEMQEQSRMQKMQMKEGKGSMMKNKGKK